MSGADETCGRRPRYVYPAGIRQGRLDGSFRCKFEEHVIGKSVLNGLEDVTEEATETVCEYHYTV